MSNNKIYIYLFLITTYLCITLCGNAKQNDVYAYSNTDSIVYNEIDDYLKEATNKAHFPAMSITIINKEDVLLSKSYGNCNSTDTPFLLGSVSKSFTALCIMQLVEQGKINLDTKISYYISGATDGDRITIRQLLNHTSGLGEHQTLNNYRIIGKQGVHEYANINYSLLGRIIESVSSQSYESYVSENIFIPLNMTNSFASLNQSIENGLIIGTQNYFGINIETNPKYPNSNDDWISVPAGYLSASTSDLGKYLKMYLNNGQGIISKESINKMFYENVEVSASIPYSYGMGWTLIKEPLKETVFRHSGLVETGMSSIYILPERDIAFAIAVNTNDYFVGKDMMDRIDWSVALMLMGDKPNKITSHEYTFRHLMYDLIYLIVLIISILPLFFMKVYKRKISDGSIIFKVTKLILLHLFLPVFIILLSRLFFSTPLWVVKAFVPDMFFVVMISSLLLFIGGIIKSILLITNKSN